MHLRSFVPPYSEVRRFAIDRLRERVHERHPEAGEVREIILCAATLLKSSSASAVQVVYDFRNIGMVLATPI